MAIGIIFIAMGILIAAFPDLLRIIVAAFLIMVGIGLTSMSYQFKKMKKEADNPFVDFFMKY